jgi:Zn-dependent protease
MRHIRVDHGYFEITNEGSKMSESQGVKIGELFGIKVYISLSWFLIAGALAWSVQLRFTETVPNQHAFLYWIFGIITVALLFASLLIHEFCHCLIGKLFGVVFRSITLLILGAVATSYTPLSKTTAKAEFYIALAGPLSNFALAGALFSLEGPLNLPKASLALESIVLIMSINIVLGLFNLLPCFPMDGGRILRAAIWWRTKNLQKATVIAFWVAIATCLLLLGALVWRKDIAQALWIGAILIVIINSAYAEYRAVNQQTV